MAVGIKPQLVHRVKNYLNQIKTCYESWNLKTDIFFLGETHLKFYEFKDYLMIIELDYMILIET